jgi:hypothetical protein
MSLRYEQCRALKKTRDFLRLILLSPRMSQKDLRDQASSCLHHYPFLNEHGQPFWSTDPFTNDDGSAK